MEVEWLRRAAAGSCGRRAREEFADWEPWGSWERGNKSLGGTREIQGGTQENSGAGRELESPGRNEEEARELGRKQTEINRRIKVLRSVKIFSISSEYYRTEAKNVSAQSAGPVWVL